jgi:Ca-activated chloride channel family protein
MHFADPQWLLIGLVAVSLLAALLVRAERLKSRALALLAGARLNPDVASTSSKRRWLRVVIATLAVAMGFVALARPQQGMHWETLKRNGIDLLLVVDTSRSMDADDVKPTRIERSKLAIRDLVGRFPGDRIGLVAFAGDAFVQSPMTLDHGALLESLDALDTSVIARGGTDVGRGIDVAVGALATEPGRQKVMVLLTDGEDLEGQGLVEANAAAAAGITIDTVGVGTLAGELVPARDAHGAAVGVVRDEEGRPVRSHLDEAGLKAIAAATHGEYRPLGPDGGGLDRLYDESLAKLTHAEASSRTHRVYSERFEIPLGLSLFGLVLEALLGRRWRGLASKAKRSRVLTPAMAAAAGLLILAAPTLAHASVNSAAKAYATGQFDAAAKDFEEQSEHKPKDARLAFDAGDAAYRAGQYEAAEAAFKRALAAGDPKLQQRVLYNEGDVLYRSGEALKPDAREQTISRWKAAIEAYDGAIALDSKDADARYNRDFVKRKLDALEEKQKQEKKDDPKENKGDQGDKSDSKGGGKNDAKGGGNGQDQNKGKAGDQDGKSGPSGSKPGPGTAGAGNQAPPNAASQGPTPGQGKPSTPGAGVPGGPGKASTAGASTPPGASSSQAGDEGKDAAQTGRLSARDARALLGALRGEERRGVSHGTAEGQSTDDSPRKDW